MLLSPQRGTIGRELARGYTLNTPEQARAHALVHLPHVFDLEARCDSTGERWHRVKGTWSEAAAADRTSPRAATPARALTEEQRKRAFWMDTDREREVEG